MFAGNNIGEDYLTELTEYLKDGKFGCHQYFQIQEPPQRQPSTFRLLKKQCRAQRATEAKDVIVAAVTDAKKKR